MKILVCMKQVPDRNQNLEIDSSKKSLKMASLTFVENDFDRYAVEAALQIRERIGGEVVVCTAGPARAVDCLRKALAMGADRAIHIEHDSLRDADSFVVSRLIAKAVENEKFDLILAGVQSEDQSYSQTGPMIAHLLKIPCVTTAVYLEVQEQKLKVKRELEGGALEVIAIPLPALVTIQTGINTPRYATLPGIMKAKKKEVSKPSLDSLGMSAQEIPNQRMSELIELSYPPKKTGGEMLKGSGDEMVIRMLKIFKEELKII
jgi:electron transfer flavoprotein beta subunit